MERLKSSNVSVSNNGKIKYPIGKLIFAVNLPSELPLQMLIMEVLEFPNIEFETNRMVQNVRFYWLFDKNRPNKQTNIFDKALTPFCNTFL